MIGALVVIQGGDEPAPDAAPATQSGASAGAPRDASAAKRGGEAATPGSAKLVRGSTYSLALPAGWERVEAAGGATFAAAAPGGAADATLWVERDPKLDFAGFEARSLEQLEALAGSARVVERTPGPTPETTSVRIAADAPPDAPRYEVLLRSSGEHWYYLATTVQPDAPGSVLDGVGVIQGSLVPEGATD